jgi:ATP synthase F1 complex assembly factor 1
MMMMNSIVRRTITNQSIIRRATTNRRVFAAATTTQSRQFKLDRFAMPAPKSLDQIVKLNLLEKEDIEAVKLIWSKYHFAMNDVVAHTLTPEQYHTLMTRGRACPMFVLPLFRNIGFVNMVLQFQSGYVLYSSLREYQKIGEFASPYLTLSHFTELERSKGVVLMRGEVNTKEIDKGQAKEIIRLMYKFYLDDKLFRDFVEPFNKTPHLFSFQNLMVAIQHVKPPEITKNKLKEKFENKYVNTQKYEHKQIEKGEAPLIPQKWVDPNKNNKK